jgi:N-acetylglutamate synthase-like GNAT family acetyltransferase
LLCCLNASDEVGVRAVMVDAKNENARRFFEHFGFEAFQADPNRLFLLLKDLRKNIQ